MLDPHSIYLIGFASQTVFALTLALLAVTDRRTRGTGWLAAGSALQLLMTSYRAVLQKGADPDVKTLGAVLLVLGSFFFYMGLRWFAVREPLRRKAAPLAIGFTMLAVFLLCLIRVDFGITAARTAGIAITLTAVPMLWNTRFLAMRSSARVAAALLVALALTMLCRLTVAWMPASPFQIAADFTGRLVTMLLATSFSFTMVSFFVAEVKRRLHDETRLDSLTGLPNRLSLMEMAASAVKQAEQGKATLSLLVLDVDLFKKLNDTWGHTVGDRALEALGGVLRRHCSLNCFAARLGGEEFAVILPGMTVAQAADTAESIRHSVEELRLHETGQVVTMTISIGVCGLLPEEAGWLDMMRRADKALYMAKHEGRNRVVVWSERDGVRALQAADSKIRLWRSSMNAGHRAEIRSIADAKRAEAMN